MDFAACRALGAHLPVVLHLWPADLLHDDLPCRHRAPVQQVFSPGEGYPQVRQAPHQMVSANDS